MRKSNYIRVKSETATILFRVLIRQLKNDGNEERKYPKFFLAGAMQQNTLFRV